MSIATISSNWGRDQLLFCEHAMRNFLPPNMLTLILADQQEQVPLPDVILSQQDKGQPFEKSNESSSNIPPGQKHEPHVIFSGVHGGSPGLIHQIQPYIFYSPLFFKAQKIGVK